MKHTTVGLLAVAVAVSLLSVCPAGEDKKQGAQKKRDEASVWMTKKLELSKKILQGLTKPDFELISKSANAMLVFGYLEESDHAGKKEYQKQLTAFRAANKELVRQAKTKDISAATKAYNQLINSCVECHVVLRDARKK